MNSTKNIQKDQTKETTKKVIATPIDKKIEKAYGKNITKVPSYVGIFSLFKLLFKTTFRNLAGYTRYVLPLLLVLVLGSFVIIQMNALEFPNEFLKEQALAEAMGQTMAQILTIGIISGALFTFGISFMDLKRSIIIKRIGTSSLSKGSVLFTFWLFSLFVTMTIIIWNLSVAAIFGATGIIPNLPWIEIGIEGWLAFLFAVVITNITSTIIAFLFISISRNMEVFSGIATLYFFATMFLGGLTLPGSSDITWLRYVGYAIPGVYSAQFIGASLSTVADPFNLVDGYTLQAGGLIEGWKASLNIFLPILLSIISIPLAIKKFKWDE